MTICGSALIVRTRSPLSSWTNDSFSSSLRRLQMEEQNLSWYWADSNSSKVLLANCGSSFRSSQVSSKWSIFSYSGSKKFQSDGSGWEVSDRSDVKVDDGISKSFSSASWNARMPSSSWATAVEPVKRRESGSVWCLSAHFLYLISNLNSASRKLQWFMRTDDSVMLNKQFNVWWSVYTVNF